MIVETPKEPIVLEGFLSEDSAICKEKSIKLSMIEKAGMSLDKAGTLLIDASWEWFTKSFGLWGYGEANTNSIKKTN